MFGWNGKILRIDLSNRVVAVETPDPAVYRNYIGGSGLAAHYLLPEITRSWRDPAMPLLLFVGPLTATPAPTAGRMAVASRSPLTGTVGDASVGGRFGTQLKKAGWDGMIITGRSDRLCGIAVCDERVEFLDAADEKGRGISQLHARLKARGATAVAGPAAENGVRFASIIFDGHYAAGRGGLGLLFNGKNLKYITVKGTGRVPLRDPEGLKQARADILRLTAASPVLMGPLGITRFGTAALYDLTASRRMMPTANFRKTYFAACRATNAYQYDQIYHPRKTGCRGCHIRCKKMTADGRILPEFETMNHFSALLENADIEIVTRANLICNELGMDTISAGATLACYAEIEHIRLTGAQILSLLEAIGTRRGLGRDLGQGSQRYARIRGNPQASISVKGLELPAYDPRGAYGMALGYAVATRGGCHLRAYPIGTEILRKPVPTDRFSFDGKARIVKIAEDANAVIDALCACKFILLGASLEEYANALSAVTGEAFTGQDLLRVGERICYARHLMNARNGFDRKDDDLPVRFFKEAGSGGDNIAVPPIDRFAFLAAREKYYTVRGLNVDDLPVESRLRELELLCNI